MELNSNIVLKVLKVLTWAGFIGLCVKVGSLMISYWVSMFRSPIGIKNLFMGLDLSQLKLQSNTECSILVLCIVSIIILQALVFFVLLQIFKNTLNPQAKKKEVKSTLKISQKGFSLPRFFTMFSKKTLAGENYENFRKYPLFRRIKFYFKSF